MSSKLPPGTGSAAISQSLLFGIFTLSGLSALLYQMVWQRCLFMIYGSNVESVAMVVTAFMAGLGIGSLVGGALSKQTQLSLVLLFGVAELGIGIYGLFSLQLFQQVGEMTVGASTLATGVLVFTLVFFPTLLMGATLPLLVAHQVRSRVSVGQAVSWLYFANTLGAGIGAFLAVFVLLGRLGQAGSVRLAAVGNAFAALSILLPWLLRRK
jgi:predicted membrane-bound spermidine synthase